MDNLPATPKNREDPKEWTGLEVTTRIRNWAVKGRRLALGLSQAELAEKVGVVTPAISHAEGMVRKRPTADGSIKLYRPSQRTLEKLADFFQCDPADLYPAWMDVIEENTTVKHVTEEEVLVSYFEARQESYEEDGRLADREETRALMDFSGLGGRERQVIERRFGLDGQPPETFGEIADAWDLTKERIRQIEGKALRKMRTAAMQHGLNKEHRDERPRDV